MNSTRQYILSDLLHKLSSKKAENVEKSVYNYTIQYADSHCIPKTWENKLFMHVYKMKACEIIHSMTDIIIQDIEDKTLSAKTIAFQKETQQDVQDESEITDGIFQCRKCGSKKTTYYSLQTRSADEPMTNFITCVMCKNRWKM